MEAPAPLAADDVARLVHAAYAALSKTGKPQEGEWTVLAGVVLATPGAAPRCIALGTGTKCLTATQIAADSMGECVHDAHAEVCARRALRAFLMAELRSPYTSSVVRPAAGDGFELQPGVQLILYTSEPHACYVDGVGTLIRFLAGGALTVYLYIADQHPDRQTYSGERPTGAP